MTATPEITFQATDLARRHREVLDAARASAGVLVRDKDGFSFAVVSATAAGLDRYVLSGLRDAVRMLRALDGPADARDPIMYGSLAWAGLLPPDDQAEFVWQYLRALESASATGVDAVEQLLYEWRQTARAWSDADLRDELLSDLDQPVDDIAL